MIKYLLLPFVTRLTPGSLGRILLSLLTGTALLRFWIIDRDPPGTMMTVMMALLAYLFGSKVLSNKEPNNPKTPDDT